MLKTRLLGLGGLARSGKDSFVAAITPQPSCAVRRVAFADAVREAAAAAFGVPIAEFTDGALKATVHPDWGITRREMLIRVGEGLRRADPDHWVKRLSLDVDQRGPTVSMPRASPFAAPIVYQLAHIVTDVRRLNEAAMIHDRGGRVVLVRRPGVEWTGHYTECLAKLAGECHDEGRPLVYGDVRFASFIEYISIQNYDDFMSGSWRQHEGRVIFDAVVDNNGSLVELAQKAKEFNFGL